jgi:hypothetical protein
LACTPAGAPTIRTGGFTDGVADGNGRALRAAERATSAPTLPTVAGDRVAESAADHAMTVVATTPAAMAMAVTRTGMRIPLHSLSSVSTLHDTIAVHVGCATACEGPGKANFCSGRRAY